MEKLSLSHLGLGSFRRRPRWKNSFSRALRFYLARALNYPALWKEPPFWKSSAQILLYMEDVSAICAFNGGFPSSLDIAQNIPARRTLDNLSLITFWLSSCSWLRSCSWFCSCRWLCSRCRFCPSCWFPFACWNFSCQLTPSYATSRHLRFYIFLIFQHLS